MRGMLRISSVRKVGAPLTLALVAFACSDAGGDVSGGAARFDNTAATASCAVTEPDLSAAPPDSWRGIFRDYFGCRSKASCAASSACHDGVNASGARVSHFVCSNLDECYRSITTDKDVDVQRHPKSLVELSDAANPDSAYLFSVISYRTRDGVVVANRGMPQLPRDFAYEPKDIDFMKAWIHNGAKND